MKFLAYLEEKMGYIIFQIIFILTLFLFLITFNIDYILIIILVILLIFYTFIYLLIDYYHKYKNSKKLIKLVDSLEEKYLISEIITPPKSLENEAYYYALKKACKAMNDKIGTIEEEQLDYQEYIESFIHEIKTPITALSLVFLNKKEFTLKNEVHKINNLVEQMLFYARSKTVEKDYFIKEINLKDILHNIILDYQDYFINQKVILNIHLENKIVYTDPKWLNFIISQLLQNSLKYLDKKKKIIKIYAIENSNNIYLLIKDNGCGINKNDIKRVFEKGFTGSNRKKKYSTGIGLYLSKKLCQKLGLDITISSEENKYTEVSLIFPKSNFYKIKD